MGSLTGQSGSYVYSRKTFQMGWVRLGGTMAHLVSVSISRYSHITAMMINPNIILMICNIFRSDPHITAMIHTVIAIIWISSPVQCSPAQLNTVQYSPARGARGTKGVNARSKVYFCKMYPICESSIKALRVYLVHVWILSQLAFKRNFLMLILP